MIVFEQAQPLSNYLSQQVGVNFVPTMGNLHQGHLKLVEEAKSLPGCVVVSIFVNPLQFGPKEDFSNYPRTVEADLALLKSAGADVVFIPSITEIYPDLSLEKTAELTVALPPIANELCGKNRPGHFQGVATVVKRLFELVFVNSQGSQVAFFGRKDFQQLFLIRSMVKQLQLPIDIRSVNTCREPDGLAMSSRNGYLSKIERNEAPYLYQTLKHIQAKILEGSTDFSQLEMEASQSLNARGWHTDYISIRDPKRLMPAKTDSIDFVVLGAAKLGATRLIDNIEFSK
jgi:pantoate--beta-alanine ligase